MNIGMFYNNTDLLNAAFDEYCELIREHNLEGYTINIKQRTIKSEYAKWIYVVIAEYKDVWKVSGINFSALFSDLKDLKAQRFLMTRLRPGSPQ